MHKICTRTNLILLIALSLVPTYVFTILWRVSVAEKELYGRSDLLPISFHKRQLIEPPIAESFGTGTYSFVQRGKSIRVHKQLINGFQHTYGSALASYELGSVLADLPFRANEYCESLVCGNSGSEYFYLDTRKDLANNAAGRAIGQDARNRGLNGLDAENFIIDEILVAMENGTVYRNCQEERVAHLPSLRAYGCPLLAKIQKFKSKGKTLDFH